MASKEFPSVLNVIAGIETRDMDCARRLKMRIEGKMRDTEKIVMDLGNWLDDFPNVHRLGHCVPLPPRIRRGIFFAGGRLWPGSLFLLTDLTSDRNKWVFTVLYGWKSAFVHSRQPSYLQPLHPAAPFPFDFAALTRCFAQSLC